MENEENGLKVITSCPLGHKCQEVKDGAIHRCCWYTRVEGINPQNGERLDRWNCAISWMPLLTVEVSGTNRSQTSAVESLRNHIVEGQQTFNAIMTKAITQANQHKKLNYTSEQD